MKVLMVTMDFPPRYRGGEGVFSEQMAKHLPGLGVDLHVVAPETGDTRMEDAASPATVHRVKVKGSTVLTRMPTLAITSGKVAGNFEGDLIYTLRPCIQNRLPTIAHLHLTRTGCCKHYLSTGAYIPAALSGILIPSEIYMLRNARKILTLTSNMKYELPKVYHPRVSILGNGVDLASFHAANNRKFTGFRILYAGRMDPGKGIFDLLASFMEFAKRHPEATLSLAGTGPLDRRIREFIKKHGLTHKVFPMGKIPPEKMPDLYRESDLLVLPSHYEGFGLVILEAMACGTPVISSHACVDLGQPRFRAGDRFQMTSMIKEIMQSPRKREKLSTKGVEKSRELGWEKIAGKLFSIFRRSMGKSCP